jgi:hypothetical protein
MTKLEQDREITLFVHQPGARPFTIAAKSSESLAIALRRASIQLEDPVIFLGECGNALAEGDYLEDSEDDHEPIESGELLGNLGNARAYHVHCHKCRRIATMIHYQHETKKHRFSPATTIAVVTSWARKHFKLADTDAEKLVLQLCHSTERPQANIHLGELTGSPSCSVCFDFVFEKKVEG